MSLKKDVIGAEVQIGTNQAQASLTKLAQETSSLANENDRLRISQAKLKALGKESAEEYKKVTAAIADNSKTIKTNQAQMDALRKTIGLSDMSMKQMRTQATNLRRELSSMNQAADPSRWKELNDKLKATETQMKKVGGEIGNTKEAMNPLIEGAKGLLPAFGFTAIAAGAAAAFGKIINSTDNLGTQWEAQMNGMKSGLNEFWRTLATGDWSNFNDRMKDAIKLGKEYVETLDDMEEKSRALQIIEAEANAKARDLELKLRNKNLSKEERKAAGEERIKLEEELAAKRTDLAQQGFDNEMKKSMFEAQLSKEQLQGVMRDFDSIDKQQAKSYIEAKKNYDGLIESEAGFRQAQGRGISMANPFTAQLGPAKLLIDSFPESIKNYARAVSGEGRTTDEQLNKTTEAWVELLAAQDSAVDNTMKVRTQVNTLNAGLEENGEKIDDKAAKAKKAASDKAIEGLEGFQNKKMALLVKQYTEEGMTDAEFKNKQDVIDIEYLIAKQKSLQFNGQSTIDIDKQINDKRIQSQKEFNEAMAKAEEETQKKNDPLSVDEAGIDPASMVTPEDLEFASKKHSLDEWVDYLTIKTKEQFDIKAKAIENEKMLQQAREDMQDAQIGGIEQLSGAMAGMFEEGSAAQIAFFALEKSMAIAQVWINYARESSAIAAAGAMMGPAGIAWEAVMQPKALIMAGINTALIVAQAVTQVISSNKGKKSGGYTDSAATDDQVVDFVHSNEFVATAQTVRNPTIKPILDIIDMAQRSGTISSLNLSALVSGGRQSGGYAQQTSSSSGSSSNSSPVIVQSQGSGMSDAQLTKLNTILDRLDSKDFSIAVETYERKRKSWEKVTSGGLK